MTCLPNWTVLYPILYLGCLSRTTHACFRNEDAENESVPYPEVQEEAPDSNPDGQALEAEPDGLEVEDLPWVLVRVDLTNWEMFWFFLLYFPLFFCTSTTPSIPMKYYYKYTKYTSYYT